MNANMYFNPREMGILEIYSYYDAPMLFLAQDRFSQKYLTIVADTDEGGSPNRWIYCPLSLDSLRRLKAGELDLNTIFRRPEMGFVISAENRGESEYSAQLLKPGSHPDFEKIFCEIVPEPGVVLPQQDFLQGKPLNPTVFSGTFSVAPIRTTPENPAGKFVESATEHSSNERLSEAS